VRANAVIKGLELPAKVGASFRKIAKKKSPSAKGDFGICQNSRRAPFGATFAGPEHCICAASILPQI